VRRPLPSSSISSSSLIRLSEIRSDCTVQESADDRESEAKRLQRLAEALPAAIRASANGPVPFGGDFGDADPDEQQVSVEARCATDACEKYVENQVEARVGMSPADFARLQQYRRCQETADAVRDVVGCVDGPVCSNRPSTPCEFSMCPGIVVDQQRSATLLAVLRDRGVRLDVRLAGDEQEQPQAANKH
jgi:hypothetical protein